MIPGVVEVVQSFNALRKMVSTAAANNVDSEKLAAYCGMTRGLLETEHRSSTAPEDLRLMQGECLRKAEEVKRRCKGRGWRSRIKQILQSGKTSEDIALVMNDLKEVMDVASALGIRGITQGMVDIQVSHQ